MAMGTGTSLKKEELMTGDNHLLVDLDQRAILTQEDLSPMRESSLSKESLRAENLSMRRENPSLTKGNLLQKRDLE